MIHQVGPSPQCELLCCVKMSCHTPASPPLRQQESASWSTCCTLPYQVLHPPPQWLHQWLQRGPLHASLDIVHCQQTGTVQAALFVMAGAHCEYLPYTSTCQQTVSKGSLFQKNLSGLVRQQLEIILIQNSLKKNTCSHYIILLTRRKLPS